MAKKEKPNGLGELKQHIKIKEPDRLYVFHGEEVFLLNHYLGQLKKILLDELTESFNYTRLNNENVDLQMFADAVEAARRMAKPGGIVLLSPACASFDAFPNFEQRGRYFKKIVGKWE